MPSGEQGGVIERWSAGDTANAVGSEELFGHETESISFKGRRAERVAAAAPRIGGQLRKFNICKRGACNRPQLIAP